MERATLASLLSKYLGGNRSLPADGEAHGALRCLGGDWLVFTKDPAAFREAFALACSATTGRVVLCDPAWGMLERTKLASLLARSRASAERGWLCIPTGGSSGELKLARHDGHTLAAAVQAFQGFFKLGQVNALGLLPLNHVSGFMAWLRCELTGGEMRDAVWQEVEAGQRPELGKGWVLSLVPTQLQRLLKDAAAADWLRTFELIFLGGAPSWPSLLDNARSAGLRLSLSYGMTETAAMVAALPPERFIEGSSGTGLPLPHATVHISTDGLLSLEASSLFYGYTGAPDRIGAFDTEDYAHFDEAGLLHIDGRRDSMIISGGKKIAPSEVEAAIRSSGHLDEVVVTHLPDAEWGQAVVACVPEATSREAIAEAIAALEGELASYKQPKRWIRLKTWPRDEKGKVNRSILRAQLKPLSGESCVLCKPTQ